MNTFAACCVESEKYVFFRSLIRMDERKWTWKIIIFYLLLNRRSFAKCEISSASSGRSMAQARVGRDQAWVAS